MNNKTKYYFLATISLVAVLTGLIFFLDSQDASEILPDQKRTQVPKGALSEDLSTLGLSETSERPVVATPKVLDGNKSVLRDEEWLLEQFEIACMEEAADRRLAKLRSLGIDKAALSQVFDGEDFQSGSVEEIFFKIMFQWNESSPIEVMKWLGRYNKKGLFNDLILNLAKLTKVKHRLNPVFVDFIKSYPDNTLRSSLLSAVMPREDDLLRHIENGAGNDLIDDLNIWQLFEPLETSEWIVANLDQIVQYKIFEKGGIRKFLSAYTIKLITLDKDCALEFIKSLPFDEETEKDKYLKNMIIRLTGLFLSGNLYYSGEEPKGALEPNILETIISLVNNPDVRKRLMATYFMKQAIRKPDDFDNVRHWLGKLESWKYKEMVLLKLARLCNSQTLDNLSQLVAQNSNLVNPSFLKAKMMILNKYQNAPSKWARELEKAICKEYEPDSIGGFDRYQYLISTVLRKWRESNPQAASDWLYSLPIKESQKKFYAKLIPED